MPPPHLRERSGQGSGETRRRVLDAARELLGSSDTGGFTIDQVARAAGVSRMTVYYQFGARTGLLEALLDDLGSQGGMERIPAAMRHDDPSEALAELVAVFTHFWASQRAVIRRLRAMAVLDPELTGVFRDERRRQMLQVLLARTPDSAQPASETLDVLQMLTGFEVFDSLARPGRSEDDVSALVTRLVERVLTPIATS